MAFIYYFRQTSVVIQALASVNLIPTSVMAQPMSVLAIEFPAVLPSDDYTNLVQSLTDLGYVEFSYGSISEKTAAYAITSDDFTIQADASGGAFTVTLPAIESVRGQVFAVKRLNVGANAVVVAAQAAETISGAASSSLNFQYAGLMVQAPATGTDWLVLP